MTPLERAIAAAGSQSDLARMIGVHPSLFSQCVKNRRDLPPGRCYAIEVATGIRCEDLRPDLEWALLPDGRKVAVVEVPKAKPVRKKRAA